MMTSSGRTASCGISTQAPRWPGKCRRRCQGRARRVEGTGARVVGEDNRRAGTACRDADHASARLVRVPGILSCRFRGDRAYRPTASTTTFAKGGRERRILIDYLRNNRTNSPSVRSRRGRDREPWSRPLEWRELGGGPERWTLLTVPPRLTRLKTDPVGRYGTASQRLSNASIRAIACL